MIIINKQEQQQQLSNHQTSVRVTFFVVAKCNLTEFKIKQICNWKSLAEFFVWRFASIA